MPIVFGLVSQARERRLRLFDFIDNFFQLVITQTRQNHFESCANAFFTLQTNSAIHILDNFARHRQTEPGAAAAFGREERFPNSADFVVGNSHARIRDDNLHGVVVVVAQRANGNLPPDSFMLSIALVSKFASARVKLSGSIA